MKPLQIPLTTRLKKEWLQIPINMSETEQYRFYTRFHDPVSYNNSLQSEFQELVRQSGGFQRLKWDHKLNFWNPSSTQIYQMLDLHSQRCFEVKFCLDTCLPHLYSKLLDGTIEPNFRTNEHIYLIVTGKGNNGAGTLKAEVKNYLTINHYSFLDDLSRGCFLVRFIL